MTTLERLEKIMEMLGIDKEENVPTPEPKKTVAPSRTAKTPAKVVRKRAKKSPAKVDYCSCRYSDLLNEMDYFPDGNAPKEHNIFYDESETSHKWYCSDKPVGFINPENGKLIIISPNAHDRYVKSVAQKWALERDWIPEYRYSLEDNMAEVSLTLHEALQNGVDKSKITKKCFDRLDYVYRAKPDNHKTLPKEETCNDADRFMYATLFTGDVETLHKLVGIEGDELPLPTEESLKGYAESELKSFEKIKLLFERVKSKHNAASIESWMSAQCYALNMPTRDAIKYIYGDRAVGKKKYRRCEVLYSRQANQVFTWLLEEAKIAVDEGSLKLDKWIKVLDRYKKTAYAEQLLGEILDYQAYESSDNFTEDGIKCLIAVNPFKAAQLLETMIKKWDAEHGTSIFEEVAVA